jgi:hypothetical protein
VWGGAPAATEPPRPDLRVDGRRPPRGGRATLVVLAVMLVVVLGGYVVAAALAEPAGPATSVAGAVSVRPLSGWAVASHGMLAGLPFVRLTRGSGNLDVLVASPYGGTAGQLATEYARGVLSRQLDQLSFSRQLEAVRLPSGLQGARFGYVGVADTGSSIEGEVTVVVTPTGHGVIFDGWGPAGLLSFERSDIETMIDRAAVT